MAGKLRFIQDGVREIGRKFKRRSLRSRLVALDKQRKDALSQLGKRSWEAKIDLSGYRDLRDQLLRLDDRAGQLSARTSELQAQSASLQSRRSAELARFAELSQPLAQKKTETDAALQAARARLSESERAIGSAQGRLKWLTAELARPEQAAGAQAQREPLLAEQKRISDQLAAAAPVRETLAAEVNRLADESRRLAGELARIEAERKSAVAPIDAELQRVQQESKGASQEISSVGREQTGLFAELGAALYGQRVRPPALEECSQAVDVIDRNRAEVQASLDASLALTTAMPRWTMLKFAAVPVLLLVVALGGLLVLYSLSSESPEPGPLQYLARHLTPGDAEDPETAAVRSEESQKDEVVQAFFQAPDQEATRRRAVEILENDLMTVGSTADRSFLPDLVKILRRGEPELRAAAGHSIGMIGPAPSEMPVLLETINDPVPAVREASLAALQQLSDDSAFRLLVRRIHASERTRPGRERYRAEMVPDFKRLGVPIYAGATYLHYASDPEIGRGAFASDAPLQQVLDFYQSASGRPAFPPEEFTRRYFGGSLQDPTGARRLVSESQAFFDQAIKTGKTEAEIRAEMERHAARMQSLPMARYLDTELYGLPIFVALEDAVPAGARRGIRYIAIFEDRALRKTGFEVHTWQ